MRGKMMKSLVLFVSLSMILSTLAVGMVISKENSESRIVLVVIDDYNDVAALRSNNIDFIDRYGRYALIKTDVENIGTLEDSGLQVDELKMRTMISVKGHKFDIEEGEPEFDPDLMIDGYEARTEGTYIVHMLGPINPEWRATLEDRGIEVINYVPNYAYHVRMTSRQKEKLKGLDFIDWIGIYHPGYKLHEELHPGKVKIDLLHAVERNDLKEIHRYVDVDSVTKVSSGMRVIGEVEDSTAFTKLARINDVEFIAPYSEPKLMSETGSQIIGGGCWVFDDDNDPSTPYRAAGNFGGYANQLGYDGSGVGVALADTGLSDGTTGDAGHPDFTGRVVGGYDWGGTGDWSDGYGHGTHCAGLIAGDTYEGTGVQYAGSSTGPYYVSQGLASESELFMGKIFDDSGSFVGPSNYYQIVQNAKQNSSSYVHSNSWGASTRGDYTSSDSDYDRAVRDADNASTGNQPMVITCSAGNSGPDEQMTGSPGNGKNVITVAASEDWAPDATSYGNTRDNTDNPDYVADFSSRGWTTDNRIKPTISAPGDTCLATSSARLSSSNLYGLYTEDSRYEWCSGTSMSNPTAAGAAAVIVDWYNQNTGMRASPAMVKAMLVNTAYDSDDSNGNTGPIPNKDEGWGLIDLKPLVDPSVNMIPVDQRSLLTTGEVDNYTVKYDDPGEPMKITLTWTDRYGLSGDVPCIKNDLDLEVIAPDGSTVYKGNAFDNDGDSISDSGFTYANTGTMDDFDSDGDGDDDNNTVECVYIPSADLQTGFYTINVIGENIPSDANNDGWPNQDYALLMSNAMVDQDRADLTIFPNDFTVSDSTPQEGDTVTMNVTVSNVGTVNDASGVEVSFYDGKPNSGGALIGTVQTTPSTIPANNGTGYAEATWDTSGKVAFHTIYAVVDPNNTVKELSELNNTIRKDVTVLGYKVEVSADPTRSIVVPGDAASYNITIKNVGTLNDSFSLSLDPKPTWNAVLNKTQTSVLSPFGTETIELTVTSNSDNMTGDHARTGVHVISDNDGSKTDSVWTNTTIRAAVLVVDDVEYGGITGYEETLDSIGYQYDVGTNDTDLSRYQDQIVIWVIGGSYSDTLTVDERSKLSSFLDNGGALFITGDNLGYDVGSTSFYQNYLHANSTDGDGKNPMVGVPGDPISGGVSSPITRAGGWAAEDMLPIPPATSCFVYDYKGNSSCIKVDTGTYRVVYMSCQYFDDPDSGSQLNKDNVMKRIINWLGGGQVRIEMDAGGPSDGWHFVSSRIMPDNTSISEVLSSIDGNYDKVWAYNKPSSTTVENVVWEDDFETNSGWTFSGGEWEIDAPQGLGGGNWGNPEGDPSSAYSGTRVLGYDLTSNGVYEYGVSTTHWAESPTIDLSGVENVSLEFQRWLAIEYRDGGSIELYNGSGWQRIWENNGHAPGGSWLHYRYDISEYADDNSNFKIRFGLGPTNYEVNMSAWNIDDVKLISTEKVYLNNNSPEWRTYVPGRADRYNTLDGIDDTMGVWVHMTSDDNLSLFGTQQKYSKINLYPGWNMVGYPSEISGNNDLPSAVDKIGYFDESNKYNIAYDYNPGSFNFEPKQGYWVHNPTDQTLSWDL